MGFKIKIGTWKKMLNEKVLSKISNWANSSNKFDRGHSWNYCYEHFQKFYKLPTKTNADIDLAALNLWAYLASWGMMRGSSFLGQECNYKVLINVVHVLIDKKYSSLWLSTCYNNEDFSTLSRELALDIKKELLPYCSRGTFKDDTLTTKIILGTCCCLPAFDIYFKNGMKNNGLQQSLSISTIKQIVNFINEPANLTLHSIGYPIMRALDAYFFCEGGGAI